jgi:N6-adenosine-specific RNA methylase IME4
MADSFKHLADIKVGKRHRKELGDIDRLAKSIEEIGLLHPVVITPGNELITGERRLNACKKLGWEKVPVTIIDLEQIIRGEACENFIRKDFLPTEINAITEALRAKEEAAAKERMSDGGKGWKVSTPSKTRDKLGSMAGVSGRQVDKIAAVCNAAKEDPKRFGRLPEEMDRTGKVGPAFSQVNRAKKHQKIASTASAQPKLSSQALVAKVPLIYADPPWKWGHFGEKDKENEAGKGRTPDQHYPTLTYDEIEQFLVEGKSVKDITAKDAALFLWCTSANFQHALKVMDAWGFEYKTHAVWVKTNDEGKPLGGTGLIFRNMHEPLIYATRGKMPGPQFQPGSVFLYPRGRHSAKPPEIRKIIEKMYPDFDAKTRLEIFSRDDVPGWTHYGFEAPFDAPIHYLGQKREVAAAV